MSFSRSRSIASSSLRHLFTATSSASSSTPKPTHHLITLIRSPIGLTTDSRRTLESLGLYRLRQAVLHPFGETTAGRILRVKELVHVSNVTKEEGEVLARRKRSEGSGVEISGRVYGGGKGSVVEEGRI
ncbi:ribosomal protein L30 [Kwoniella shandongensis]|uniref:Large ribosomal subunit protein uL30m n=1 Tax=Kwoniella shandongensis TaxID=1734106 RepID=A0A5M6BZM7_9TREE|nr:ribosomal protein L30 [Kwoniella shandongensis]KAA5528326.1 ribosomal protein L30 [Kwoniella shandongensis]